MSSENAVLNCTSSPWRLESNSDISGIGILIGFAATAYSTLLLCVTYYLVDHKRVSNPVDQQCIDKFYRLLNQSRPSETWTKALEAAVLTLSDQQVITGIAILISGYSQLRSGLAVYYWQLTVDLAWFSSITHLTTLTCLRYYFQERQGLKILRLISMAVTAGMLSCALVSTGYLLGGDYSYDYPAWCLFHPTLLKMATNDSIDHGVDDWTGYYNTFYVVVVLLLLFVSYGARIIQLFPSILNKIRQGIRVRLSTFAQRRLLEYKNRASGNLARPYWASVYTLTLAIYCILKAAADLYSSMLWEITWLATALVWGSIRIIMDRDTTLRPFQQDPVGQDLSNAISKDDVWGFGQVVTVALLLAPLFSLSETIYESVTTGRKNYGRLPASAPTDPILPDPVSSPESFSTEPWTDMYKCAWFRSLVWLIYLQSLAAAGTVLLLFPLSSGSSHSVVDIGFVFRFYLAWFGVDLAILFLFTITSLSLCHTQDTSGFRWTWRAKLRANWRPSKRTKLIQRIILNVSVLVLTASSVAFGWALVFEDI